MASGYDFFSQPQGPQVPFSLFADSAKAGIDAGNAQKTQTQAIVEGLTKGVQTGQEIAQNQQTLEINQKKIERLPIQDELDKQKVEMNQQEIDQKKFEIQMKQMELETKQTTESVDKDVALKEAQVKLSKATKDKQTLDIGAEIEQIKNDPNVDEKTKADLYVNPKYSDYWAKNPEEQKKGIFSNYHQYSPDQKQMADYLSFGGSQRQYEMQIALAEAKGQPLTGPLKDYAEAKKKLNGSASLTSIYNNLSGTAKIPVTEDDFLLSGDMVPFGTDPTDKTSTYQFRFNGKDKQVVSETAANAYIAGQNALKALDPDGYQLKRKARALQAENEEKGNINSLVAGKAPAPDAMATPGAGGFQQQKPLATASPSTPTPEVTETPTAAPTGPQYQGMPPTRTATPAPTEAQPDNSAGGPPITSSGDIATSSTPKEIATSAPASQPTVTSTSPIVMKTSKELQAEKESLTPEERQVFDARMAKQNISAQGDMDLTPKSPIQLTHAVLNTNYNYTRPAEAFPGAKPTPAFNRIVQKVSSNQYLKNEPPIVKAVASAESAGNPKAVSPTGVTGLMQLTRDAAIDASKILGRRLDRDNEKDNAEGGAAYLKYMISRFPGRTDLALAAYNAGEGRIKSAIKLSGSDNFDDVIAWLEYESKKPGSTITHDKVKEIAAYPGRVKQYLYSFAHDKDPVWMTQI